MCVALFTLGAEANLYLQGESMKNHSSIEYLIPKGLTFSESTHKNLNRISFLHQQDKDSLNINFSGYDNTGEHLIEYASQEQFNYVVNNLYGHIKLLVISASPKIEDFSLLEGLIDLEFVFINWNHKAKRLWNMKKNINLKEVVLEDCKKIYSLEDLETATHIRGLQLLGHWETKWKVENFEPLSSLSCLEVLRLFQIVPERGNLEPIYKLHQLKQLDISEDIFSTEEYAKLAANLSNTCSDVFNGVLYSSPDLNEINLVGKGKRPLTMNKAGSREKANKFREDFLDMVRLYQKTII